MAELSVGAGLRASFFELRVVAILAALAASASPIVPAFAQEEAWARTHPSVDLCQVFAVDVGGGAPKELRAFCQGQVLMLGSVSSFEIMHNKSLKATLIEARNGVDRRVLLLAPQGDGTTLAEDLTGQIALEAGRGPMSSIDDVPIDLKAFPESGEIAVRSAPEDLGRKVRISLGPQISAERARRDPSATHVQQ